MKRYYISPKAVWEDPHPTLGMPMHGLMAGSSCVELQDSHILICTEFRSSAAEDIWHAHPEVARLFCPISEPNIPLMQLHQNSAYSYKQFQQHHFDKLQNLLQITTLPLLDSTHTIRDLHARLVVPYPGLRLNFY